MLDPSYFGSILCLCGELGRLVRDYNDASLIYISLLYVDVNALCLYFCDTHSDHADWLVTSPSPQTFS